MIEKRALWALLLLAGTACGGRDKSWGQRFSQGEMVGLTGSAAIVDRNRNEVMMLTSPGEGQLDVSRLGIGKNVVRALPSQGRDKLFVLTSGIQPRLHEDDERPQLIVFDGGTRPRELQRFELGDPLEGLVLDPEGEWAVAFDAGGVVVNPNELILIDLTDPNADPLPRTIRSTGGHPERLTFTSALEVPGSGRHRLLVVETAQDVVVLDLADPEGPEISVPLPETASGATAVPAGVVFHDGLPDDDSDAYLAVRFANDANVLTLRLDAPRGSAALSLTPNLLDAGSLPSVLDFVQTDAGLRLAVLLPNETAALLFDPETSRSERVDFDHPYSGIARITRLVDDIPETGDVALLFSDRTANIAFWSLGQASSTPYASFESYGVDNTVSTLIDIPGEEFAHMKILASPNQGEFFLLDLKSRLSHPMLSSPGFNLRMAPDGLRAWAFLPYELGIARLTFDDKHPITVAVERPVTDIFDIERSQGSGRTAFALHTSSSYSGAPDLAATVFNADNPDSAHTRFVSGLILEGL